MTNFKDVKTDAKAKLYGKLIGLSLPQTEAEKFMDLLTELCHATNAHMDCEDVDTFVRYSIAKKHFDAFVARKPKKTQKILMKTLNLCIEQEDIRI